MRPSVIFALILATVLPGTSATHSFFISPFWKIFLQSLYSIGMTPWRFPFLAAGVATWIFAPLQFQADMGTLLTFMFLLNMLGAIFPLPALACWLSGAAHSTARHR